MLHLIYTCTQHKQDCVSSRAFSQCDQNFHHLYLLKYMRQLRETSINTSKELCFPTCDSGYQKSSWFIACLLATAWHWKECSVCSDQLSMGIFCIVRLWLGQGNVRYILITALFTQLIWENTLLESCDRSHHDQFAQRFFIPFIPGVICPTAQHTIHPVKQ